MKMKGSEISMVLGIPKAPASTKELDQNPRIPNVVPGGGSHGGGGGVLSSTAVNRIL
jgi:hypothetical protein